MFRAYLYSLTGKIVEYVALVFLRAAGRRGEGRNAVQRKYGVTRIDAWSDVPTLIRTATCPLDRHQNTSARNVQELRGGKMYMGGDSAAGSA